jgi:hypothetical protein
MKDTTKQAITGIVIFGGLFYLSSFLGSSSSIDMSTHLSDDPMDAFFENTLCRNMVLTRSELQGLVNLGGIDLEVSQEFTDRFNGLPTCYEFCKTQLEYSNKYDDWFAENDLRKICDEQGVNLPK